MECNRPDLSRSRRLGRFTFWDVNGLRPEWRVSIVTTAGTGRVDPYFYVEVQTPRGEHYELPATSLRAAFAIAKREAGA